MLAVMTHHKHFYYGFGLLLYTIIISFNNVTAQQSVYAIKNVNIIPMTLENKIIRNAILIVGEEHQHGRKNRFIKCKQDA